MIYAAGGFSIQPQSLAVPDERPRKIAKNGKCGGSPTGTTEDQCIEGLFCQYQTPTYAKCVKDEPASLFNVQSEPPHECGAAGTKCMGDGAFLEGLGAGRVGVCCEEGLRCVFQGPYEGVCADPKLFLSSPHTSGESIPDDTPTVAAVDDNNTPAVASPDTRPREKAEHKKCVAQPLG